MSANPYDVAWEARRLRELAWRTKFLGDEKLPIYFEHMLARIDALGLAFEDVVKAGIISLAKVKQGVVKHVDMQAGAPIYVSTVNWRQQIDHLLKIYGSDLSWPVRTELRVMRSAEFLTSTELYRLECILGLYYGDNYPELEEQEADDDRPFPAGQLGLEF